MAVTKMSLLPAAPGKCSVCAVDHEEHQAHDFWSIFYQVHFKMRHGRDPTHADTVAHLPDEMRALWRELAEPVLAEHGQSWTEPEGEPIAEPYATN
jgi:hypothetical protein